MSHIFINFLKQNLIALIATCFISLTFISCNSNSLKKKIGFDCDSSSAFNNLIEIKDAKLTFETQIPSNWKRELFVDNYESRLYAADTTKELNNAYIFDLGHYSGELKIDKNFKTKISNEINSLNNSKITEEKTFIHKEKEVFYISYSSENANITLNNIQLYLKNKNNSFYKLKIDVYGKENIEQRFCNAIELFEHTILYQ
jgi:hypothetical protein